MTRDKGQGERGKVSACETCAFGKKGIGGAADEVDNVLKAQVCAFGAIPFYCHHGKDGTEYGWHLDGSLGPYELAAANRKVCEGWKRRVAHLAKRGFFGEFRAIRRAVAAKALKLLETFLAEETPRRKKKFARRDLEPLLQFLTEPDIGDKEIPL